MEKVKDGTLKGDNTLETCKARYMYDGKTLIPADPVRKDYPAGTDPTSLSKDYSK